MSDEPRPAPRSTARPESREVLELQALKAAHPELSDAIDLQLALLDIQRRVQGRIPLPTIDVSPARVAAHLPAGRPLLEFADIPLDVGDLRLVLRQTAEVLSRFGLIEESDHLVLQQLARDGDVRAAAADWFARAVTARGDAPAPGADTDQAWALALRPFLSRCADAIQAAPALGKWTAGCCAACGGEAELGILEPSGTRRLICGQCGLRWTFDASRCPHCPPGDAPRLTTFTTADRVYQVTACESCRRYLKSVCTQYSARPVLPVVDTLATLPLDAAAVQRGYGG